MTSIIDSEYLHALGIVASGDETLMLTLHVHVVRSSVHQPASAVIRLPAVDIPLYTHTQRTDAALQHFFY